MTEVNEKVGEKLDSRKPVTKFKSIYTATDEI